jgi:hypothetical protein
VIHPNLSLSVSEWASSPNPAHAAPVDDYDDDDDHHHHIISALICA